MAEFPESIGKYKIVSLVAKGGMGAVYKAMHPTLKRHVIIKKLTIRGNAVITERFRREAQILLDFNDPHIVHLFDYFKEGTSHYIVLEYVDGMSLDVLLKKRRYLSGPLALHIFMDACKALKYAHDNGVIHRDIKPGNILISKSGSVKLADFGIAATDDESDDGLTKEGMTLGTASYMPPEQFKNTKNVDKRADIYAMGVMLYEMVTGKKPFPGNFNPETLIMIQKGKFENAKRVNPETPPVVSRLIRKMIRPNPKKRFKDMSAVIKIVDKYLRRYQTEALHKCLIDCMNTPNFEEPVFRPRTKKRVVALSLAAFLLASGGAGWWAWTNGYVHRYVMPDAWGAVQVSVRVPVAVKEADDVFVRAKLYVNDRKDFPDAGAGPVSFSPVGGSKGDYSNRFESNVLYVRPGSYRIKIFVEQRIYWHSFTVDTISSLAKKGLEKTLVSVSFDNVVNRVISLRTEAFDALNGRNVTSAVSWTVLEGGEWIPLDRLPPERLVTGTVRKFRAEAPDYYPEAFSLKIAPYQDEMVLHANLIPLPGTLRISAPQKRMTLRLNGSSEIILGGEDMKRASLEAFKGGDGEWSLPAGRYDLEVWSGKNLVRTDFIVSPGKTTGITIAGTGGKMHIEKATSN